MDHRINMRQPLPLAPLFPGLNLTYALKLLQSFNYSFGSFNIISLKGKTLSI